MNICSERLLIIGGIELWGCIFDVQWKWWVDGDVDDDVNNNGGVDNNNGDGDDEDGNGDEEESIRVGDDGKKGRCGIGVVWYSGVV